MTLPTRPKRTIAAIIALIMLLCPLAAGCTDTTKPRPETTPAQTIARGESHDPSIVKADGRYYIFGSHLAFLQSDDLVEWKPLTNNLTDDYASIFADIWNDWSSQSTNPDVKGNMWAPDVLWNPAMRKWCMYMSINGDNRRSAIVLLTADDIAGDWSYVGPVVYSGFSRGNASRTDIPRVLGADADLTRYQSPNDTGINAIDPCVTFDEDGGMWMTYGSWFGGIWMLRLDPATGLRDYTVDYFTKHDASDAYYGVKIAGGHGNSGEGPYLIHTGGWWYLFVSYGHLQQKGGYQIRMFRSKKITGPYVDEAGHAAITTRAEGNNWQGDTGVRLMGSVQWSGNDNGNIEVAQGHNSVLIDDDGTVFLVYHTRFSGSGERHEVRVRQMLPTADGWLVAAPYEYIGVKADMKGYATDAVTGDYELVTHDPHTAFKGPKKATDPTSTDYRGVNRPVRITLHEDGTITGARQGTWKATAGTNLLTMSIDGVTYQGAFDRLPRDKAGSPDMTFSAIGGNQCVWGLHR